VEAAGGARQWHSFGLFSAADEDELHQVLASMRCTRG